MPTIRRVLAILVLAGWGLAGWGLAGCAPRLVTPLPTAASPVGELRLVLGPEGRATQWADAAARARIRVAGPGMAQPIELVADLSSEATASVTLDHLPAGPNRIVTLERLDDAGAVVAGGTVKTTVDVPADARAEATIGRSTTPRGAILERVLAADAALAATLDEAGLQSLVEEVIRKGADFPDLVDAGAIASDVLAGKRVPAFETRYVLYPAKLDVTLEGIPGPAPADVWVDDPLSPKNVSLYNGTHRLAPIAPGTWVVHARSAGMGREATRSITLGSDEQAAATLNLGAPPEQLQAAMPRAGMASAAGVLSVDGTDWLFAMGGIQRATDSVTFHNEVWGFDGATWSQAPSMPTPVAYAQASVLGSELYVAGGIPAGGLSAEVVHFDGKRWAAAPALPEARGSAALATLGGQLYVIGGFKDASWGPFGGYPGAYDATRDYSVEFNATESFRFDPVAQTWTPLSAGLGVGRGDMAATACNGRIYVFGGQTFTDDAGSYMELPRDIVESTDGAGPWRLEEPMPTARGGAAAVAVGSRIFVIGGCTIGGIPLNSVEVFDTLTGHWSIQPPLRRARGYVSAAYLGGRIVVAGGGDGGSAGLEGLPQDSVESLVP